MVGKLNIRIILVRELALKVWMTSGILPGGARTFLGVIEGGAKYFFTIQEGGANNFFVDNNYKNNLYFVQYERNLSFSCNFFALRALFYLFVNISQISKF